MNTFLPYANFPLHRKISIFMKSMMKYSSYSSVCERSVNIFFNSKHWSHLFNVRFPIEQFKSRKFRSSSVHYCMIIEPHQRGWLMSVRFVAKNRCGILIRKLFHGEAGRRIFPKRYFMIALRFYGPTILLRNTSGFRYAPWRVVAIVW